MEGIFGGGGGARGRGDGHVMSEDEHLVPENGELPQEDGNGSQGVDQVTLDDEELSEDSLAAQYQEARLMIAQSEGIIQRVRQLMLQATVKIDEAEVVLAEAGLSVAMAAEKEHWQEVRVQVSRINERAAQMLTIADQMLDMGPQMTRQVTKMQQKAAQMEHPEQITEKINQLIRKKQQMMQQAHEILERGDDMMHYTDILAEDYSLEEEEDNDDPKFKREQEGSEISEAQPGEAEAEQDVQKEGIIRKVTEININFIPA
jgi:hypothetical protein